MKALTRIREQLQRIRSLSRTPEAHLFAVETRVSGWCTAEHLDHILKVSAAIVGRVRDTNATPERRGISLLGRLILLVGWIPRGRGRSPKSVVGTRIAAAELEPLIAKLEQSIAQVVPGVVTASRVPIVPHPYFGGLTRSQALRFVAIHNAHHLRIVDEILRSSARKNASAATSRPSL